MTQSDKLVQTPGGGMPRLREIMARLRDPNTGCPWDIEQTYDTIAPYTIEEAYEVADAIERKAFDDLRLELGDLLLQVIYYTQMAEEEGRFTFDDVVEGISDKMVHRHPHVFGDESRDKSAEQQTRDWERIKASERASGGRASVLEDVPMNLPALTRALKLQKRAARVGFDWPSTDQVMAKIVEEAGELTEAHATRSADATEDEFGDLLFVITNLGRHMKIDPEAALRRTNAKFTRRFQAVEQALEEQGKTPQSSTLEEMDALWDAVKAAEKSDG